MSRMTRYYDDYLGRTVDYQSTRKSEAEILGYDTGRRWPTEWYASETEKVEKPKTDKDQQ